MPVEPAGPSPREWAGLAELAAMVLAWPWAGSAWPRAALVGLAARRPAQPASAVLAVTAALGPPWRVGAAGVQAGRAALRLSAMVATAARAVSAALPSVPPSAVSAGTAAPLPLVPAAMAATGATPPGFSPGGGKAG